MKPFSGLTLIIHILIIGIGKMVDFFKGHKLPIVSDIKIASKKESPILNAVISIVISGSLSILMLSFFFVAINTSIREGAREWPRQQMKEVWTFVGNNIYSFSAQGKTETKEIINRFLNNDQIGYERPITK